MGHTLPRIGAQLYTVRDLMAEDFEGTIERVAEIGYDEVEFAGYFDHTPEEVRAVIDRVGITAPAVHVGIDMLRSDLASVLDAAVTVGHEFVVCPYLAENERTLDHYRRHADFFNEVGETCRAAGVQLAYHNHEFEFIETDGVIPYEFLLDETDPELVAMELDLYWVEKAGHDALAWFASYPGRFPLCHVKDMAENEDMTVVGSGTIDFAATFAANEEAGLRHWFVEHDFPSDSMASLTNGYTHLAALRY